MGERDTQYAKMEVVPNVQGETVVEFAQTNIEAGSTIGSDGYSSYKALSEKGFIHEGRICDPVNDPEHLRWLHIRGTMPSSNALMILSASFGFTLECRIHISYIIEILYIAIRAIIVSSE